MIYSSVYYYMELNVARMLHDLNIRYDIKQENVRKRISLLEEQFEIELEEQQRTAVAEAAGNGLLIVTGGPAPVRQQQSIQSSNSLKQRVWRYY